MKTKLFIFICFSLLICSCKRAQEYDTEDKDPRNIRIYIPKDRTVPDSVGGKKLLGWASLDILVSKDIKIKERKIKYILAGFDSLRMAQYSERYSNTPKNDSIYKILSPWLSSYLDKIEVGKIENDKPIAEEGWESVYFPFNKDIPKWKPSGKSPTFSAKLEIPQLEYPDFGLQNMSRGEISMDIFVKGNAEIQKMYFIGIEAYSNTDTTKCTIWRENSDRAVDIYNKFIPIIEDYSKRIKVKEIQNLLEQEKGMYISIHKFVPFKKVYSKGKSKIVIGE